MKQTVSFSRVEVSNEKISLLYDSVIQTVSFSRVEISNEISLLYDIVVDVSLSHSC